MTASTTADAVANAESLDRRWRAQTRSRRLLKNDAPQGLYFISQSAELPTTSLDEANDIYEIIYFPANRSVYIMAMECTADDLDSGATPALVFSVNAFDGSTTKTYIASTSIGQGGGSDSMDADLGLMSYDVGGYYLCTKVGTGAATAATGTIKLNVLVYVGDITSVTGT